MATAGSEPVRTGAAFTLVDTSVAVALVVADHEAHETVFGALEGRRLGLAGHAAFETFSVLTRLPPPARRTSGAVARLLEANFPETRFLARARAATLYEQLARLAIAGGAVYDALVGAVAIEFGAVLATRDRRAIDTYRALEVRVELVD